MVNVSAMQFCPWYPLPEAASKAPAAPGVWQVRLANGLRDYPTGKSAMVNYGYSLNVASAAQRFGQQHQQQSALWVCRHLVGNVDDATIPLPATDELVAFYDKLRRQFSARFGAEPTPL
jgi:hypothetical protein